MAESDQVTSKEPIPRSGLFLTLGGVALGLLTLIVVWFQGDADWFGSSEPQLEEITPRTEVVARDNFPDDEPADIPEPPPDLPPATVAPIDEGLSEDEIRRAERARLASESPLSPPVRDLREMIRAEEEEQRAEATETEVTPSAPNILEPLPLPKAKHNLARGTVIPTVLESALDSALPGLVRARVSENVFDTLTGKHILIPRGSRLIGRYQQAASAGSQRLFVSWDDLRMPNGDPIELDDFSSLGADGAAGIRGRRSTGLFKAFGAAILFDLAGNATQILTGQESTRDRNDLSALLAGATGTATERVAEQYLGQILSQGTRFRVKAGAIMNVLIEEDLALPVAEPWS
ncbi:MAG: hypothetical protein OXC63_08270 [Aestuariivita sp.]|nr:hypothetical protein [Aestuariivita sp.]MCY4345386.1 hypothetical protein [Aestuariivita sp.]